MELSDETYRVIADEYGADTADYVRKFVENPDSNFPNLEGLPSDVGLGVVMDDYLRTLGEEDLETALEEFAGDLEETRRRGVLELLSAEANSYEI